MSSEGFISGLFKVLGALVAILSSGCTIIFYQIMDQAMGPAQDPGFVLLFGGIPFSVGCALWGIGYLLEPEDLKARRKENPYIKQKAASEEDLNARDVLSPTARKKSEEARENSKPFQGRK